MFHFVFRTSSCRNTHPPGILNSFRCIARCSAVILLDCRELIAPSLSFPHVVPNPQIGLLARSLHGNVCAHQGQYTYIHKVYHGIQEQTEGVSYIRSGILIFLKMRDAMGRKTGRRAENTKISLKYAKCSVSIFPRRVPRNGRRNELSPRRKGRHRRNDGLIYKMSTWTFAARDCTALLLDDLVT